MSKRKDRDKSILKEPSYGYTDNFPKREMWREIAKDFKGEFKIKHNSGNELEIHTVSIPYKNRNITVSVSDSRPLKFEISFLSSRDFNLILSWEDFIDKIIKKFSKPEIQLGEKEFDTYYFIKSNNSDWVKKVLTKEIQKTLLKYNVYSVSYQTDSSKRTAELISVIQRKAGNKKMIFELIEMFKLLIDNLEKSGIIR